MQKEQYAVKVCANWITYLNQVSLSFGESGQPVLPRQMPFLSMLDASLEF